MKKNEKKYHTELVDLTVFMGGWGHKTQRMFTKGTPDVELKVSHKPLVKCEVKHEVYKRMPEKILVALTELQRKALRDMQKVGIACGWVVFVSVGKDTFVYYSRDPAVSYIVLNPGTANPASCCLGIVGDVWKKDEKLAVLANMIKTYSDGSTP